LQVNIFSAVGGLRDEAKLRALSVVQGLVVTVLNVVVSLVVDRLTHIERHTTTTSHLTAMVFKLTVFYFLNSFAVPIIAVVSLAGSEENWCVRRCLCARQSTARRTREYCTAQHAPRKQCQHHSFRQLPGCTISAQERLRLLAHAAPEASCDG
jgi:Calcium-activated chloride channel